MDKIFEVDSTAVLSKVSEAAVTHCRQERDGGRTWDIGKGKRKEEKSTLLHGNNIMPFCRPQMSDSLNVTLVLRFETIWVMSKHITQQKHATKIVENHTLRPSCILCNGGHTVTHQTVLTLLSSSVLCQLPLGFYNLYDGEQNQHHWQPSAQHTSSSTSTKLLVVTITTKGMYYWKQDFSCSFPVLFELCIFNMNRLLKLPQKIWHSEIVMVLMPKP